ncbi:hypothetical protein CDCA_CDCA11G3148 [Cyanidium caldarium]|uniref:CAAX prenyl protease 2/Lysostaphin resistance protein A-like domain-containing protein n=1 Tax=Cyanidium caldarium TaxID=2771 RepID=A0AAV9IZ93_CYACA|nr:hypothetical protein CDCA_CDCA11G3148 [Cyanidium caldarium]
MDPEEKRESDGNEPDFDASTPAVSRRRLWLPHVFSLTSLPPSKRAAIVSSSTIIRPHEPERGLAAELAGTVESAQASRRLLSMAQRATAGGSSALPSSSSSSSSASVSPTPRDRYDIPLEPYAPLALSCLFLVNYLLVAVVYLGRMLQVEMLFYSMAYSPWSWLGMGGALFPLTALALTLGWPRALLGAQKYFGISLGMNEPLLQEGESAALVTSTTSSSRDDERAAADAVTWIIEIPVESTRQPEPLLSWPVLLTSVAMLLSYLLSLPIRQGALDGMPLIAFVCLMGALHQPQLRGHRGFTWTDATVWLLVWTMLDAHWYEDLFLGRQSFVYDYWAAAVVNFSVIGWICFRHLPGFGYRLVPRRRDLGIAVLCAVVLASVIPPAVAIGYLPPINAQRVLYRLGGGAWMSLVLLFAHYLLTVALAEEVLFRGILLNGLDLTFPKRRGRTLLASSMVFGMSHWGHETDLGLRLVSVVIDTLGGVAFGMAYRLSGNNVLAPAICHALINTFRELLF